MRNDEIAGRRGVGQLGIDRRQRVRAMGEHELVLAMREGDTDAWAEFDARLRPLLRRTALRSGVAPDDVDSCVTDVLDDEAMRFVIAEVPLPRNFFGYFVQAIRLHHLAEHRASSRRDKWHRAAAMDGIGYGLTEPVITSLCSSELLRSVRDPSEAPMHASGGQRVAEPPVSSGAAFTRWVGLLISDLSDLEWQLLAWVSEQVPRREMAAWLDADYEATKRRVTRLLTRLRARALARVGDLPPGDQREVMAWLKRAGLSPAPALTDQRLPDDAGPSRTDRGDTGLRGGSSDDA